MDSRKCQTLTASPAQPGDLPWFLELFEVVVHGKRIPFNGYRSHCRSGGLLLDWGNGTTGSL